MHIFGDYIFFPRRRRGNLYFRRRDKLLKTLRAMMVSDDPTHQHPFHFMNVLRCRLASRCRSWSWCVNRRMIRRGWLDDLGRNCGCFGGRLFGVAATGRKQNADDECETNGRAGLKQWLLVAGGNFHVCKWQYRGCGKIVRLNCG